MTYTTEQLRAMATTDDPLDARVRLPLVAAQCFAAEKERDELSLLAEHGRQTCEELTVALAAVAEWKAK